jgi:pimeloyl-ACP methyl ester carboxylesterase
LRTPSSDALQLTQSKVQLPVVAIGGAKGLGARVGQFVSMVAANVESVVLPDCGHFVPEESPAILEQLSPYITYRRDAGFAIQGDLGAQSSLCDGLMKK